MKPINDKQKLEYLNAVAKYFRKLGYKVNRPTVSDDFLDVWGKEQNQTCFVEIYLTSEVYLTDFGYYACWGQSECDAEVDFNKEHNEIHSYDNFEGLLEGLEPIRK